MRDSTKEALAAEFRTGLEVRMLEHARQRVSGTLGVVERGGEIVALCAHRCQLAAVPARVAELPALERLDVGDNGLTELPALAGAARLTGLYIYDNQLERLGELPPIDVLDANRNRLFELPLLRGVSFVYLAENQLRHVPATEGTRYLNVCDNALETFEPADAALREIRAERCGLRALPPAITRLSGLRELSLRSNALTHVPAELGQMRSLETLDLRGNQLDDLPEEMLAMPALRKLDLRWNPLRRMPSWLDALESRGCAVYV
jgi:Leucine-rich repeat (LRR) protein